MPSPMTADEQFQCMNLIEYLLDLFAAANKETFSRDEILIVLNRVSSDPDFFDPEVQLAHAEATAGIGDEG